MYWYWWQIGIRPSTGHTTANTSMNTNTNTNTKSNSGFCIGIGIRPSTGHTTANTSMNTNTNTNTTSNSGFCIGIGFILRLVLGFPLGFIWFTRLNPNSNSNSNATFMRSDFWHTDWLRHHGRGLLLLKFRSKCIRISLLYVINVIIYLLLVKRLLVFN